MAGLSRMTVKLESAETLDLLDPGVSRVLEATESVTCPNSEAVSGLSLLSREARWPTATALEARLSPPKV